MNGKKEARQWLGRLLGVAYKLLPLLIGIYCYYPAFERGNHIFPFLDALYSSLKLYSGYTEGGVPVGGLLQFARFLALAASLSILIGAFSKMNDLLNRLKLFQPKATVVYGNSSYADHVLESLPRRLRIAGGETFIDGGGRYVLMFSSDAENLEFYNRNYEALKNKNVYMMLDSISRQNIQNHRVSVFSMAENCARQYWKEFPVTGNEKIALIGFGDVGKNILLYGLLMNLIDPAQHFEYHVYGDGTEFRREHTELDKMAPDEVIFHDDGVYQFADMAGFDRIIICGSGDGNENVAVASKLLVSAPVECRIYLYAPTGDIITNLFGADRMTCFGTAKKIATGDIIFKEQSMADAKKQHEFYYKKYGGTPWEELDSFKRYSNVSSSDYMCVIDRLLAAGVPLEKIAELEHIRWCRYHYIYNWKYAPKTDPGKRQHNCLLPFAELSEEEKRKDVEAIRSKMTGNS